METVSVSAADSPPGRLKEEGGTAPPAGNSRASPPPNCAICLGQCQNKSFTDSCLHQFCFNCLLTWSKIKAECPLCKQTFKSIIHNVRSNHQYEEYLVEQRHTEVEALAVDEPGLPEYGRRFRYRTTITFPRREGTAIHRLLLRSPLMTDVAPPPRPDIPTGVRRQFRHTVYRHNVWAQPLPDFTGRYRQCSPEFYSENEAQRYRLVPWLTRELHTLLGENRNHIAYVMARIVDLVLVCPINSPEFLSAMLPFFGERTEHFLHEFHCFASTPYDLLGYDRNVRYGPDPRVPNVGHVISSTDSDGADSDIVMVTASESAPAPPADHVIPIETISQSDSEDSSSEVMVVGYIKPPQDRTPEIVDLLASDSDVLVQENSPSASTSRDPRAASPLVKLTLSRRLRGPDRRLHTDSDSDADYEPRRARRPKKRVRSQGSASTSSTRGGTSSDANWNVSSAAASPADRWSPSDTESYTPPLDVPVPKEKKPDTSRRHRKVKRKRARSRSATSSDSDRRRRKLDKSKKRKSRSGRDADSRRRRNATATAALDRPGTSGTQRDAERRRLRSVVCTLPISSFTGRAAPPTGHSIDNILASTSRAAVAPCAQPAAAQETSCERESPPVRPGRWRIVVSGSDSEDDLPLNLTVKF